MKVKDIIKKQTTIIAIAVVLVVIATIGVSYAVFFDVQTNKQNQVITAGTLELTFNSEPLTIDKPTSIDTAQVFNYTIQNTGNLPANYSLYIYNDGGTLPLDLVMISFNGGAATALTKLTTATITDGDKTYYTLIENQTLNANGTAGDTTGQKNIKVWVDESLINDELTAATLNLNLYLVSEVKE